MRKGEENGSADCAHCSRAMADGRPGPGALCLQWCSCQAGARKDSLHEAAQRTPGRGGVVANHLLVHVVHAFEARSLVGLAEDIVLTRPLQRHSWPSRQQRAHTNMPRQEEKVRRRPRTACGRPIGRNNGSARQAGHGDGLPDKHPSAQGKQGNDGASGLSRGSHHTDRATKQHQAAGNHLRQASLQTAKTQLLGRANLAVHSCTKSRQLLQCPETAQDRY
jgi:hypothetical protein